MCTLPQFHESYHDHQCAIIPEKDILEIDITGKQRFTVLRRWWCDLFLLSVSDPRSKALYTGSHSMRMDRILHFRRYRNRIHPLSKFRNFWDCLLIIILTAYMIMFHHNSSIIFARFSMVFYYLTAILDVLLICDVIFTLKSGYIDKDAQIIVLDLQKGLLNFTSYKLFMHCAAAMPLQLLMFLRYGSYIHCAACKSNNFVHTLKVLCLFKLIRLWGVSEFLGRERQSFMFTHCLRMGRVCLLGLITMLQFIDLCDMISFVAMVADGKIEDSSYFSILIRSKFVGHNPPESYIFFFIDFARICKSLLLFSFGLKRVTYYMDRMTSLIAYLVANLFYFWSFLECYTAINRLRFLDDQIIANQNTTLNLLKNRQLPDLISNKVEQYYSFKMARLKVVEKQNGLFRCLPEILKREAFMSCYGRRIMRIPYFSDWPHDIIEDLVMMLQEEIYLANDMVAETWVQGDGLVIIDVGIMAVYSAKGEEKGHLIDGDFFGELSLVTDKEIRMSYVVAVTPCKILMLPKMSFRRLMRRHAGLFFEMKRFLKRKFSEKLPSDLNLGIEGSEDYGTPKDDDLHLEGHGKQI